MSRARRRAIIALGIGGLLVVALAWAIPSLGGRLLVDVAVRVSPIARDVATGGRSIVLPDGSPSAATRLRIQVALTNRYPLPVVVEFHGSAIHANLRSRDRPAEPPAWRDAADDPSLESGDDSPDAGTSRVTVVQPGTTILPAAPAADLILDAGVGTNIAPGIYVLRVSAFGIEATPVLLSIVDAAS
jgi:hypothetical protein